MEELTVIREWSFLLKPSKIFWWLSVRLTFFLVTVTCKYSIKMRKIVPQKSKQEKKIQTGEKVHEEYRQEKSAKRQKQDREKWHNLKTSNPTSLIGPIHILGIGMELACDRGWYRGISLKRDECHLLLKRLHSLESVAS